MNLLNGKLKIENGKNLSGWVKLNRKPAFTLAEVLITLGIIGVVAGITMPTLIQNHRKSVVITSLKKSYSIFQQAVRLSEVENGSFDNIDAPAVIWNADSMEEWWNKYMDKYFNGTKHYKTNEWLAVQFSDGSGIGIKSSSVNRINMHVIHCISLKKCMENEFLKATPQNGAYSDGRNSFVFVLNGNKYLPDGVNENRDVLKGNGYKGCASGNENSVGRRYCSTLIMHDGWQIKDDYPVKF